MDTLKDDELFELVRIGDKKALSILFMRYYDQLFHFGCRIADQQTLVEESIQELFLYIFESHARLSRVMNVKAYLFRSLQRRLIMTLRQERKITNGDEPDPESNDFLFIEDDIQLEELHLRQSLVAILNSLPWQQREAIYLRYYNNLSTKEIAEIMDIANQTVLNTLHIALKKIRHGLTMRELILFFLPLAGFLIHCA